MTKIKDCLTAIFQIDDKDNPLDVNFSLISRAFAANHLKPYGIRAGQDSFHISKTKLVSESLGVSEFLDFVNSQNYFAIYYMAEDTKSIDFPSRFVVYKVDNAQNIEAIGFYSGTKMREDFEERSSKAEEEEF